MPSGGMREGSGAKRKGQTNKCVVCGTDFYVRLSFASRQCCSSTCAGKMRSGVKKPLDTSAMKYAIRICPTCGKEYQNASGVNKYCSHKCSTDIRKGIPIQDPSVTLETRRASNARHNHIKRARRRGNESESFNAIEIYERDKWKCHLCGKKINKDAKWPDAMSASLDHVVPCSLGGPHLKVNVKASHLRCNVRKGNRSATEQTEMFG